MRSLKLKFPDSGQEARAAGYTLLLLGIVILMGMLYQLKAAMDEAAYWDSRIAGIERMMQRKTAPRISSASGNREIKQEVTRANAVLSQINLPWEALFNSVEYASSYDVALLSFQPDAASRTLRIGGEAKNMSALLDFVGTLERESVFEDAYLLKYEIKQDDPQQPIIFSLVASWIE
ncbi:MAG: fimbrial assembly protein [Nitrosomonadaceae bacterium]|nr:fimbrial assembly protein [Nitrosospira sp.]MDW7597633.1 fimbrial assembly protein [Nitrosomonadaceae bacterium]MBI0411372.1 fimbrial assembly protein [Nitrosospira sp.]MDW7619213.1 fimbrial assembly protein [Nitrosomonadaceae bacterium]MDW7647246.1 fimbrial assembly protein [Nitrosomonadaceae bacterium]